MGKFFRLSSYCVKFLTDQKYRNHVFNVIDHQISAKDTQLSQNGEKEYDWAKGKRIFLIGGCELTHIKEALENLGLKVYHTFDYGASMDPLAETEKPNSALWGFQPDYIIFSQVQLFRGLVKRVQSCLTYHKKSQLNDLEMMIKNYQMAIVITRKHLGCPIFLMTYPLLYRPVFGIHEYHSFKNALSLIELLHLYELKLYELARFQRGVYVLNINIALEEIGKRESIRRLDADAVYEHLTRNGNRELAKHFLYQAKILEPNLRHVKCAVFDLDGTLWTGVLREDGQEGVAVRRNILNILLHLSSRGIILAICSKNDPEEEKSLRDLLGEDLYSKIALTMINWNPKSHNLRLISKHLNIGIDSIAFFDDNSFERAEVSTNVPEVMVFTEKDIQSTLTLPEFLPFGEFTPEATSRTEKYIQQAKRNKASEEISSLVSYEDFLQDSQFVLNIRRPNAAEISRLHELFQRTNQLNATVRRSSREDIERFYKNTSIFEVYCVLLSDKYGDYGLIGGCIIEKGEKTWKIVELAFSCRAMGRKIEHALLNEVSNYALKKGITNLSIEITITNRNKKMREILGELDFELQKTLSKDKNEVLKRKLQPKKKNTYLIPRWFKVQR